MAQLSLSAKYTPKDKKSFSNAIINSGSALGMIIGLVGSSVLVGGLNIQWNYMLYMTSIIILAVTCVFVLFIKSDKSQTSTQQAKETHHTVSTETQQVSLFAPKQLVIYFVYFATCYGYYMIVTWLPSFLVAEKNFEQSSVGYVAAIVAITAVPGALIFSKYIDKNAHQRLNLIVFTICSCDYN